MSHNDEMLAYSLDLKGSEYFTIYVRRISDNKIVSEEIKETSGESPDNTESVGVEEFLKDKNIETEDAEKTRKQLEATRKAIADMPNPDDPIAKEMTRGLKKREQELLGKQAKENPDGDVWKDLR